MSNDAIPLGPLLSLDNSTPLLNVHLAEYQTLTTRMTYWISIQYVSYSVIAALLAFIAQLWNSPLSRVVLLWGGALVLQLMAWAWLQACCEILNVALYLETKLKPAIGRLLSIEIKSFWGWESFLAQQRSKGFDKYEWSYAILILPIAGAAILPRLISIANNGSHWTLSQYGWASLNIYIAAMIFGRSRRIMAIQKQLRDVANAIMAS